MEKPNPSLNVETSSKALLPKKSIMDWEPDEKLKKAIEQSWGLESINERSSDTRSK
jgi:hypothetical protein